MKSKSGFSIVEVAIIITVIAILVTIGTVSYLAIQRDARDSQRASKTTVIAESMEKYYDKNGEYPNCELLQADPETLQSWLGLDKDAVKMPQNSDDSAVICDEDYDIHDSADDVIVIHANSDSWEGCREGGCDFWELYYREEATGDIITIKSRHYPIPTSSF